MERVEGVVSAVSAVTTVQVHASNGKRMKLQGALVEVVNADGKPVHLLLTSSPAAVQRYLGRDAVFVVGDVVLSHGKRLRLCEDVREMSALDPSAVVTSSALPSVDDFKSMWDGCSDAEKLVWMDRHVSFAAVIDNIRPWAVAQLSNGLCLFKPPMDGIRPRERHCVREVIPVYLWNELQGFSCCPRSNVRIDELHHYHGGLHSQQHTLVAYHGYFLAWRHTVMMCLERYFAKTLSSDSSSAVVAIQRILLAKVDLRMAMSFLRAFCRPLFNALPERANLDPDMASERFPKTISVYQTVEQLLTVAESQIARLLGRYSHTDRRSCCHTIGVFRTSSSTAVLAAPSVEQSFGAQMVLRDDYASVVLLGAALPDAAAHSPAVVVCRDLQLLIHVIPASPQLKTSPREGKASNINEATPIPAQDIELCKATTIRSALQNTETNTPLSIFGIVLKKEIHAAYQRDDGTFPPQLVVTFIDPEFVDTLHVYLPVEFVHRVIPGCVLEVTMLKMHARGDRFLYYKGSRASFVTVVRGLTNAEMGSICKMYDLIANDNPRVLEPHYLQDKGPDLTTTLLRLRQQIGKPIWLTHAIIIDIHFLLVTVKCSGCQAICAKQSKGETFTRFSCPKCQMNGIRVRLSWEGTLVIDDGTDQAKLSIDDDQLLHVLEIPTRLKNRLERLALKGVDICLTAQDLATAPDDNTACGNSFTQLRQHIRSHHNRRRLSMFVRLMKMAARAGTVINEGDTSSQSTYNGSEVYTSTFKGERLELQLVCFTQSDVRARAYHLLSRLRKANE